MPVFRTAFVLFADEDPILGGAHPFFRHLISTAADQPVILVKDASHFLQEDPGAEIAGHIPAFIERTS